VKEVRDTLTKRKKRLEDDLDRYKKKLSSSEASVKVSTGTHARKHRAQTLESSERELKSAVQDVKKNRKSVV
jgi:ribosomal protein L9